MNTTNKVWTEKFRPLEPEDVCGCKEVYHKILPITEKPGNILIHGPPGTGKTTEVDSACRVSKSN